MIPDYQCHQHNRSFVDTNIILTNYYCHHHYLVNAIPVFSRLSIISSNSGSENAGVALTGKFAEPLLMACQTTSTQGEETANAAEEGPCDTLPTL